MTAQVTEEMAEHVTEQMTEQLADPIVRARAPHPSELVLARAQLRAQLEEQRAFRVEQLAQLAQPTAASLLSSTDPEILRELMNGARAALREVQAALWRMDDATYGQCTGCGHPIEAARLEILPATATCLPCRRAADSGAPASHGPAVLRGISR